MAGGIATTSPEPHSSSRAALFRLGMAAPHPVRPNYPSRSGHLIPEGTDRQRPPQITGEFA